MGHQEKLIVQLHWFLKTIQWSLPLTRGNFQPLVTFDHSWLEMAPHERQSPFKFPNTSVDKQILISRTRRKSFGTENHNQFCNFKLMKSTAGTLAKHCKRGLIGINLNAYKIRAWKSNQNDFKQAPT